MANWEELLEQLEQASPAQASMLFEHYVLSRLEQLALAQGAELVALRPGELSGHHYDAVVTPAFEGLQGPVAVQVAYTRSAKDLSRLRDALLRAAAVARDDGIRSILLVHPGPHWRGLRQYASILEGQLGVVIAIWGAEELERRLSDGSPPTVGVLALEPLHQALRAQPSDWRDDSDRLIADLSRIYAREGLALFIGAGVSQGAGLPSWNELVASLFLTVFTEQLGQQVPERDVDAYVAAVRELNGNSSLLLARYLKLGLSGEGRDGVEDALQRRLTQVLYRNLDEDAGTEILRAIARLTVPTMAGSRIRAIVTYNFDDVLERIFDERGLHYESIYRSGTRVREQNLPVMHVHGYLPRSREGYFGLEESLLAFSEEGYHELYRDPYHWSNIAQVNLLREKTCLLLWLSLTDPNLRRLLEITAQESSQPRHYAFMKRSQARELLATLGSRSRTKNTAEVSGIDHLLDVHHALQERVLAELGVQVVWFSGYEEMPIAVDRIRMEASVTEQGLNC